MRLILLATILWATLLTRFAWTQEQRGPNVLSICGDDHAPYVLGAYGIRREAVSVAVCSGRGCTRPMRKPTIG